MPLKGMRLVKLDEKQALWSNHDPFWDIRVGFDDRSGSMLINIHDLEIKACTRYVDIVHNGHHSLSQSVHTWPHEPDTVDTRIRIDMYPDCPDLGRPSFPLSANEPVIAKTIHQVPDEEWPDFVRSAKKHINFLTARRGDFATSYGTANTLAIFEVPPDIYLVTNIIQCAMGLTGYQDFKLPQHVVSRYQSEALDLRESTTKLWTRNHPDQAAENRKMQA